MPLHDDAKSQLNARYLEGLASIEKRKIQNEARGAAVGLCLFGVDNRQPLLYARHSFCQTYSLYIMSCKAN